MKRRMSAAAAAIVLLITLACGITGCKKKTDAVMGYRFPIASEPRQIDPQVSIDSASVMLAASLFEGLARLDEQGKAVPAAASWDVSEDGLTYTFCLTDSKWSDGSQVTAQDFVFGMQRAVMPNTDVSVSEQLFGIQNAREIHDGKKSLSELGVKAVSDEKLCITLNQPDSAFPYKTAMTPYMPCKQSFFEETEGRYGIESKYLLTNGPFYLKKWTHNESILLNKNEGYHDAAAIKPSAVRYLIGDVTDPVKLLKEENLDAAPIPAESLTEAKQAGLKLTSQEDTVEYVWLNNSNQTLADAGIRCALRDAIEWDVVQKQLNAEVMSPATGFLPTDSTVAGGNKYRTDTNSMVKNSLGKEAASELYQGLQRLGLKKMPQLTMLCADDEYSTNLARYIIQSWQKNLSMYINLQPVKASELAARVKVGNYEIAMYSKTAEGPEALEELKSFGTGAIGNYAHFSNAEYDQSIAALSSKETSRTDIEGLETRLWNECPSIPISFVKRCIGLSANGKNVVVRAFDGGPFGAPYDFYGIGNKAK